MIDVEPHLPTLRRYARSLTRNPDRADDLVQDTVVRAIEKADRFQPGTNLRAWLMTVMRNLHVNQVRGAIRRGTEVDVAEQISLSASSRTDSLTHLREVGDALARLPWTQRRLLLRAALLGSDKAAYAALARYEDVPIGTVRSRLSRGRAALRLLTAEVALSPEEKALLDG